MATIKDVAAAAGVSLGTVSNVINGKTNNPDLIERVEKAIEELGFVPDAKARSLKSTQTYLIGVVVNSIEEYGMRMILSAIEKRLRQYGYSIVVKTTDNNAILEKKHIDYFLQLGVDGIIVGTSVRRKKWLYRIESTNVPVVFLDKSLHLEGKMDAIQVDYSEAFRQCFSWCYEQGFLRVGVVLEKATVSQNELEQLATSAGVEVIPYIVGDKNMESGFKATFELLSTHDSVQALVLGGFMLAKGAQKAAQVFGSGAPKHMVCIKTENWMEDEGCFDALIEVSNYEIGCLAADRILDNLRRRRGGQQTSLQTLRAAFRVLQSSFANRKVQPTAVAPLRIALLKAQTADVLVMLSKVFTEQSGIPVEFVRMDYSQLTKFVQHPEQLQAQNIDVIMYDIIWRDMLVSPGILRKLDDIWQDEDYCADFIDNILEAYVGKDGSLYGLPFLTGTQLLFFQNDLFEDQALCMQFQREYGYQLKVPETWNEFNDVARFFTQSINKRSPVEYGTALIRGGNLYNSIEYLNRLWAMGSDVIADNRVHAKTEVARIALESYLQSFAYSDPSCNSWEDIADIFKQGKVAMVTLYDSYAFGLNDSMQSRVAGNVGSGVIPGRRSVLGGWGLGVFSGSQHQDTALEFIQWACGKQIANPFAVLSGISSRKSFYLNTELDSLYPWKSKVLESYSLSRMRSLLEGYSIPDINLQMYDTVIGAGLGRAARGECDADTALSDIDKLSSDILEY